MKNHNRIEMALPFKESDCLEFKKTNPDAKAVQWRIVAIFEKGNFLVAEHNDKPKQMYIDKLIESINAGETKVIS